MKNFRYLNEILPTLDEDLQKAAQMLTAGKLTVDLFELESMVNPDKFEFPEEEVETVGVEVDK